MQPALRHGLAGSGDLRRQLRHVYWLGGGSGGGKSIIARRIASRYGMRVYATDDLRADHARRMPPDQAPYLSTFAAMTMDERWVVRTPQEMLDTFHWFHGEGFRLIIEDLLQLPGDQPVIAEGFRLLPHLVQPLLADSRHAVWLLPDPGFRQDVFDSRGGPSWGFLAKTGNPEQALSNLLERDRLFTNLLTEQVRDLALPVITVSSAMSETEAVQRVAATFGLAEPADE